MTTYNCPNCGIILHRCGDPEEPRTGLLELGVFVLDRGYREVTYNGEKLKLTNKEYDLLVWLMEHHERVVTRKETIEAVWGEYYDARDTNSSGNNLLSSYLVRLKHKTHAKHFVTVRGYGHRFVGE